MNPRRLLQTFPALTKVFLSLSLAAIFIAALAEDGRAQLLDGHRGTVMSVAFSPDGKILASGGGTLAVTDSQSHGELKLWDTNAKTHRLDLEGHKEMVFALAFSPDGRLLASGSDDGKQGGGTLMVWDVAEGKEKTRFDNPLVRSLAFAPDGKTLWASNRNTVIVYDVEQMKRARNVRAHDQQVTSFSFSKDGKYLASGSEDATVKIWNPAALKELAVLRCGSPVAWAGISPTTGKVLAAAGADIQIWDWSTNTKAATLSGHEGKVWQCAFLSDHGLISVGDDDIKIWDLRSQSLKISLKGDDDSDLVSGRCVATSSRGQFAVGAFGVNTFLMLIGEPGN
jgi:WD40 repeat protein